MIDTSLFVWFTANSAFQIQEGKIDFNRVIPWLWFRRASTNQERLLSGAVCDNFISEFDVEVVSDDIDAVQNQADTLKTLLQAIMPASMVGATFCQYIEVNDHSDDYIPRSVLQTDDGLHVASFQVKIWHRG